MLMNICLHNSIKNRLGYFGRDYSNGKRLNISSQFESRSILRDWPKIENSKRWYNAPSMNLLCLLKDIWGQTTKSSTTFLFYSRFPVILHHLHQFYALDNLHAKVLCAGIQVSLFLWRCSHPQIIANWLLPSHEHLVHSCELRKYYDDIIAAIYSHLHMCSSVKRSGDRWNSDAFNHKTVIGLMIIDRQWRIVHNFASPQFSIILSCQQCIYESI